MTDASSDSDESAGRVQEWEVVSLSTLSMSGSGGLCACEACTSAMEGAGSGRLGEADGPNVNFMSNHFGSATTSPMLDQFLGSEGESRTGVEDRKDTPMDIEDSSEKLVGMETDEEIRQDASDEQEEETGASDANYLPEMDWIEPMAPNTSNLMRDEGDIPSNSSIYDMECDKKPTSESDHREIAGPLFGSCMSAPSAAIVSSVAAFRAGFGEDIVHSPIEGEESVMSANCVVEEELAGLEREILGTDSGFESFPEVPALNSKKLGPDDDRLGALTDSLLGEGAEEYTGEAWWKRPAVLWFMEARQANTLWSLALAAAVMGLVILGQRWQHERCQNNHLRLQLCSKDEKISQLIFQVARLKDALSGRRRVPVLRSSTSYSSFRDRF